MVTVLEEHVPEPKVVPSSLSVTVLSETQEIVKSGVVSEVTSSAEELPESVPAVIFGVPGAASAVLSKVTLVCVTVVAALPKTSLPSKVKV